MAKSRRRAWTRPSFLRIGALAKQLNTSKKKIVENAVAVEPTLLFLSQFQTAPVDQGIVDEAAGLHRQWNPSHGLDINAAITGAAPEGPSTVSTRCTTRCRIFW